MDYKVLLLDLDGTLLNSKGEITEKDAIAIKKAVDKDVRVILSSGRSNMSMQRFIIQLGLMDKGIGIAYNGGTVFETYNSKKLVEHLLDDEYAREIIKICRIYDVSIMVYSEERLWIDKCTKKIENYANRSRLVPILVEDLITTTNKPINKVIIIGSNRNLKQVEAYFMENGWDDKINMCFSAEHLFEFNPIGIDKGYALVEMCEKLGIDKEQVIAMGDNYNDESMIREAGLGVAVKNAVDAVKNVAQYITENDNNNGAVAEVIEKYIL